MNMKEFKRLLDRRVELTIKTLGAKGEEYSRDADRLHNFKRAAHIISTTPEKALLGMKVKHTTSIEDIVDDIEKGKLPSEEMLEEKIGDEINYYILLEALIKERIKHESKRIK